MSWWTVYLWTRLSTIVNLCEITVVITGIAAIIATIMGGFGCLDDDDELKRVSKIVFGWIKVPLFISILCIIFVPNSKEFAMIYVVPKIANSQMVQKDFPDLYKMAMEAIKEQFKSEKDND